MEKEIRKKEYAIKLPLPGLDIDTTARITGDSAKEVAYLLDTILRQAKHSKGKSRLTEMIKTGEDLTAFSIGKDNFKLFAEQVKNFGLSFCLLQNKYIRNNKPIYLIVKNIDAPKVQRIIDRLPAQTKKTDSLISVETKTGMSEEQSEISGGTPTKTRGQLIVEEALKKPEHTKDTVSQERRNPFSGQSRKKLSVRERLSRARHGGHRYPNGEYG